MTEQSKFVLTFDRSATEVSRRPNLRGEYQLAGEESAARLSLWGAEGKTGKLYARGQATPIGVSYALRARTNDETANIDGPPNLDLKVGEAVLFENDKATKENRQPNFYGYAREATRVVRFAGWERGNVITGNAEPYRPSVKEDVIAPPTPEFE